MSLVIGRSLVSLDMASLLSGACAIHVGEPVEIKPEPKKPRKEFVGRRQPKSVDGLIRAASPNHFVSTKYIHQAMCALGTAGDLTQAEVCRKITRMYARGMYEKQTEGFGKTLWKLKK